MENLKSTLTIKPTIIKIIPM